MFDWVASVPWENQVALYLWLPFSPMAGSSFSPQHPSRSGEINQSNELIFLPLVFIFEQREVGLYTHNLVLMRCLYICQCKTGCQTPWGDIDVDDLHAKLTSAQFCKSITKQLEHARHFSIAKFLIEAQPHRNITWTGHEQGINQKLHFDFRLCAGPCH